VVAADVGVNWVVSGGVTTVVGAKVVGAEVGATVVGTEVGMAGAGATVVGTAGWGTAVAAAAAVSVGVARAARAVPCAGPNGVMRRARAATSATAGYATTARRRM